MDAPSTGTRPKNAQILVMLAVASLLLVAGLAILQSRAIVDSPQRADYPDDSAYQSALRTWRTTIRTLGFVGVLFLDLAVGLAVLGGFLVALTRTDLPDHLRRSMVVMPLAFAAVWLVVYFLLGNFLLGTP